MFFGDEISKTVTNKISHFSLSGYFYLGENHKNIRIIMCTHICTDIGVVTVSYDGGQNTPRLE